jgi:MoaA/NifB/PqqE/SkfB family radical SAM enzyme
MFLPSNLFFCQRPFEWFEIFPDGTVYVCCPSWLRQSIGNLFEQDLRDIWNSPQALAIRRSILERSYAYCDKKLWPFLNAFNQKGLTIAEYARSKHHSLKYPNETLRGAPHTIACSFDRSCNLSCASCRNELISLKKDSEEMKKAMVLQSKVLDILPQIKNLYVTGSGDPFASHVFYSLLRAIDLNKCPQLRIQLISNGILLKPRWDSLANIHSSITSVEISIDAASADVYQAVRGGDFLKLMESLQFIGTLRKRNMIPYWRISFVVQAKISAKWPNLLN